MPMSILPSTPTAAPDLSTPKYVVIYHDGDNLKAKYVSFDLLSGPFGVTPEMLGLPSDYMLNAVIEVQQTELKYVHEDDAGTLIILSESISQSKELDLEEIEYSE